MVALCGILVYYNRKTDACELLHYKAAYHNSGIIIKW